MKIQNIISISYIKIFVIMKIMDYTYNLFINMEIMTKRQTMCIYIFKNFGHSHISIFIKFLLGDKVTLLPGILYNIYYFSL